MANDPILTQDSQDESDRAGLDDALLRSGDSLLLSASHVGSANRGRVLQALFDYGPMSRAELARHAGVNRTTISGIVQPLVDADVLVETDPLPAAAVGGKRARPLWFSPEARPICGALVMANSVSACLATLDGHILAEVSAPIPAEATRDEIIALVEANISAVLKGAPRKPLGIGVGVGGMVDTDAGSIVRVNLAPALDGCPLKQILAQRFGMTVVLDHHPRALLVGDRWFGKGRGRNRFAVVFTGEVLGAAFALNGRLYRGAAGAGGELGHTFVQLDGELCKCGRRGCWDTIATLSWLRKQAAAAGLSDPDDINAGRLMEMVADGNKNAADVADTYARNLAVGLANLQQTLAPNVFILHGDAVLGGADFVAAIAKHLKAMVPARPGGEIQVIAGHADDRAALIGAAGLVLSERLSFTV
jgi:predicted NBD/HSP70 family sugar kinase/DNA-binding MarR family transcriptional regulator